MTGPDDSGREWSAQCNALAQICLAYAERCTDPRVKHEWRLIAAQCRIAATGLANDNEASDQARPAH